MKALFIATIFAFICSFGAFGQNKADSLKLKRDIEAIKKGKKVRPPKNQSILNGADTLPVKIDTAALKPDLPQPTPTHPNNPNPHEPVPSPVNPSPPDTPSTYPQVPKASPKGQESGTAKKKE